MGFRTCGLESEYFVKMRTLAVAIFNYEKCVKWLNLKMNKLFGNTRVKKCVVPFHVGMVIKRFGKGLELFYPIAYPEDYDLAFRFHEQGLKCIPCNEVLQPLAPIISYRTSRTSTLRSKLFLGY